MYMNAYICIILNLYLSNSIHDMPKIYLFKKKIYIYIKNRYLPSIFMIFTFIFYQIHNQIKQENNLSFIICEKYQNRCQNMNIFNVMIIILKFVISSYN